MITASNHKKPRSFISVLFLVGIIILSGCSRVDFLLTGHVWAVYYW